MILPKFSAASLAWRDLKEAPSEILRADSFRNAFRPGGPRNLELRNEFCISSIFTLQSAGDRACVRAAPGVRDFAEYFRHFARSCLQKNWSVRSSCDCASLIVLPVWMQSRTPGRAASAWLQIMASLRPTRGIPSRADRLTFLG